MPYEAVIGLEVHAELATRSKMFCACAVVDTTRAEPNQAVCPVCAGMPGVLPVVNRQAVEYGLRVALALGCQVATTSLFARKNYFYPDLPKGYQISQYEQPLAANGCLAIDTPDGERPIRIRRVHLEEDTGKLTHVTRGTESFSLVDLNRAGVPLLEIVSEPDLHSTEEVRAYATGLRSILRELGVNSGDMEKGVIRFEANVSLRPLGDDRLGTRVEIKNLNSFRSMERAIHFELDRQAGILDAGGQVEQETLGWNEAEGQTFGQRSKEEAHDYRYFPEPDLPPLVIDAVWIEQVGRSLPELPYARKRRFASQYGLSSYQAALLGEERAAAAYFEACVMASGGIAPGVVANWMLGELAGWQNQTGTDYPDLKTSPAMLAELLKMVEQGELNQPSARAVFIEMLTSGRPAGEIAADRGLQQISDAAAIAALVRQALVDNPREVESYRAGKGTLSNWFFGLVMKLAGGRANPALVRSELEKQLRELKSSD